jgi:hypothetical protein
MPFLGCPRGHTIDSETRLHKAHPAPNDFLDTRPRTRALRESDRPAAGNPGRYGVLAGAQAACRFSCSGSKRCPFFQMVKTMAAILRATVRRAMVGRIPVASVRASRPEPVSDLAREVEKKELLA